MLHTLLALAKLSILVSAGLASFLFARNFVRHRLRFVDAVRSPFAPLIAGVAAFALAWPLAALPLVSMGTAITVGVCAGLGTASGARSVGRAESSRGQLYP